MATLSLEKACKKTLRTAQPETVRPEVLPGEANKRSRVGSLLVSTNVINATISVSYALKEAINPFSEPSVFECQ